MTTAKAHAQRRLRKQLGLPEPSAHSKGGRTSAALPQRDEREVITNAALDVLTFVEHEAKALAPVDQPPATMSIAELALDNTLYASRTINAILRKYHKAPSTGDAEFDLKRDTMAGQLANATMRTLARVHEVHLRGQNVDRLSQILEEIKALDDDEEWIKG